MAPIIEGGGFAGLTAEGGIAFVSAGNAGAVQRYAVGDPITPQGYLRDGTFGVATFGVFRGVGAYGAGWRPSFTSANAVESETVVLNNGWRTLDGRFASPLSSVRPGGSAEVGVWDAIAVKPGWSVRTGNVAVRDASGQLRYYDGIAISPRGRVIGLEVKSGSATLTPEQRLFDSTLNSSPSNVATGVGQSTGTTVQRSILLRPGQ